MKNIILDTDIGGDCDDVGALALLNVYADMGLCRILGIGHCTSNPYGAGAIDAICRSYGRPELEIGTWKGVGFADDEPGRAYNKPLTERCPNRYRDTQPEDVVRVYRRILAAQPDASVEFIAIGPLNNMSALLDSAADDISSMTGYELVSAKVVKLTMMAGAFQPSDEARADEVMHICGHGIGEHAEYNVVSFLSAAINVADNWPTPKAYLGFEAGLMETGASLIAAPADDPVRMAYELWNNYHGFNGKCQRYSWDPMTVVYAILGDCEFVKNSAAGKVRVTCEGYTRFTPDAAGTDHYADLTASDERIVEYINGLLCSRWIV